MDFSKLPKATDIVRVKKSFSSAFVLDKTKITRIINIIENRYGQIEAKYALNLKNGKSIDLVTIEEVFNQDNAVKNPIVSFEVKFEDAERPIVSVNLSFDNSERSNIALQVVGIDPRETNQLYAELEEQLERTVHSGWVLKLRSMKLGLSLIGVMLGIVLLIIVGNSFFGGPKVSDLHFTKEGLNRLEELAKSADTMEKKVDFLFELDRGSIAALYKSSNESRVSLRDLFAKRNLLVGVPLLIIGGLIFYGIIFLYPTAVFLWGDYENHYNQLVARRRGVWSVVVVAFGVSIVAGLFMIGLADFIKLS